MPETETTICQNCQQPVHSGHEQSCMYHKERFARMEALLSPKDLQYVAGLLKEKGGAENLFSSKGKYLHTTASERFMQILSSGVIQTSGETQITPGASFTDGDFPEAVSFQLVYDHAMHGDVKKMINSENYNQALGGSPAENFFRYFWDNHHEAALEHAQMITMHVPEVLLQQVGLEKGEAYENFDKAIQLGQFFFPDKKGWSVTIVFDKSQAQQLGMEKTGTSGLQSYFEDRSYLDGGVPLSMASSVLVPQSKQKEIREALDAAGYTEIRVVASEELEVRRILEKC